MVLRKNETLLVDRARYKVNSREVARGLEPVDRTELVKRKASMDGV